MIDPLGPRQSRASRPKYPSSAHFQLTCTEGERFMRRIFSTAAAFVAGLLSLQTLAQTQPGEAKFRDLYKQLIETNTALSAGDCTLAAERMATRLKAAGMAPGDVQIFTAPDHPKEGGLVAVYPGKDPKLKAVLLLAHIDVVEAKREDWTRDPFTLVEENGSFYARGAIDDKAEAAIWVDTLVRFSEEKYRPRRTVKMALTCGEETAGAFNGAQWLSENRRDLIDAAFAVNEGAFGELDANGRRVALEIQAGEKTPQNYRLEVTNPGGHSSRPVKDNAIYRLAAALTRIEAYEFPAQFTDASKAYFSGMAQIQAAKGNNAIADAMNALVKDPNDRQAIALVSSKDPSWNATLRTTCVATMLDAGHAPNQLPHLPRCLSGIGAPSTRGAGRRSCGKGRHARDARAYIAAAAADGTDTQTRSEVERRFLPGSSGSAHIAARRHGWRVSDRRRHPHLWHRTHIRRTR